MPSLISRRFLLALGCLSAATSAFSAPANAQLGALRRAAERRVEQKAEDRVQVANLIEPTFDNTTLEITPERLERYTAAMEKLKADRAANRARYEAMQTHRSALIDSSNAVENRKETETYNRATQAYESCRSDVLRDIRRAAEASNEALAERMRRDPIGMQQDPKVKEMMAALQEMAAAQRSNDTAAVRRATERMHKMGAAEPDSAGVDRAAAAKCGARPAKPGSLVRAEEMRERAAAIDKAANELNRSSGGVSGALVGMTDAQAKMMWERIQSWLWGMRQDAAITRTFTRAEYDQLVASRGKLQRAFSGS